MADKRAVELEAWRLHREEGHPPKYAGPCWGPTWENIEQAKVNLARQADRAGGES